jgi:hypothetical protein
VASLVSTAFSTATAASGSPPNIQAAVAQLQQQISDQQTLAAQSSACMLTAFLQNGGLLTALAQPIEALQLPWSPTETLALAAATVKGYELEIWKALTPIQWMVDCNSDALSTCVCGNAGDPPPDPYPDQPNGDPLFYKATIEGFASIAWIHVAPSGACDIAPSQDALDHLFHTPNPDGTGPLGVSLEDIHCGLNGWSIPGSLGQACLDPDSADAIEHQMKKQNGAARAQIGALISKVRADVKNKAVRDRLTEPLQQARSLLQKARRVKGTSLTKLAELSLQGFILQAKAHAGQDVPAALAQEHIARAHRVRGLLIEALPLEGLGAALAPQKNS